MLFSGLIKLASAITLLQYVESVIVASESEHGPTSMDSPPDPELGPIAAEELSMPHLSEQFGFASDKWFEIPSDTDTYLPSAVCKRTGEHSEALALHIRGRRLVGPVGIAIGSALAGGALALMANTIVSPNFLAPDAGRREILQGKMEVCKSLGLLCMTYQAVECSLPRCTNGRCYATPFSIRAGGDTREYMLVVGNVKQGRWKNIYVKRDRPTHEAHRFMAAAGEAWKGDQYILIHYNANYPDTLRVVTIGEIGYSTHWPMNSESQPAKHESYFKL